MYSQSPTPENNTFHFRHIPGYCFSPVSGGSWCVSEQKVRHRDWGSVSVNQWDANLHACPSNLQLPPPFLRTALSVTESSVVWWMRHCCCDVCCHPELETLVKPDVCYLWAKNLCMGRSSKYSLVDQTN